MLPDLMLAKSLAGHDKNHIYVVAESENDFYYLINGTTKKLENPKKKKRIHLQPIKRFPESVREIIHEADSLDDMLAMKILEKYQEEVNCQKQM